MSHTCHPFITRDSSCRIVIMGVSGCGKSSVGAALGDKLHIPYIDGDDYHSAASIAKMSRGQPLDDHDRGNWLSRLAALLAEHRQRDASLIIGCSALKHAYRQQLRRGDPELIFIFLDGDYSLIAERMQQRHHFFSPAMLNSQFETLEPPAPDEAIRLDIRESPTCLVQQSVARLQKLVGFPLYSRP